MKKAAILTIGTELTTGEITNTNAAWIADRLTDSGLKVIEHRVIPDSKSSILGALRSLNKKVDLLIVCGGLGPTSDDVTRDVLADWSGELLHFNESVWKQLQDVFKERGLRLRDGHRRQCLFPRGAEVLPNRVGTAQGFYMSQDGTDVYILPGPPKEIESIWEESIAEKLQNLRQKKSVRLHAWRCLGIPESEVAHVVEDVVKGSGLEVGYRASVPWVIVKLWVPETPSAQLWVQKMDRALGSWVVKRGVEDPLEDLRRELADMVSFEVVDDVTQGYVAQRLLPLGLSQDYQVLTRDGIRSQDLPKCESAVQLSLRPSPEKNVFVARVYLESVEETREEEIKLPKAVGLSGSRSMRYLGEVALFRWAALLRQNRKH